MRTTATAFNKQRQRAAGLRKARNLCAEVHQIEKCVRKSCANSDSDLGCGTLTHKLLSTAPTQIWVAERCADRHAECDSDSIQDCGTSHSSRRQLEALWPSLGDRYRITVAS